jgi:uncharacterized BrkB/YihY/UPF0761 family membrane protein
LADFIAFIVELVITGPAPIRLIVALLTSTLIGGLVYWFTPNKTAAGWVWLTLVILGIALGLSWHKREGKYDRPA